MYCDLIRTLWFLMWLGPIIGVAFPLVMYCYEKRDNLKHPCTLLVMGAMQLIGLWGLTGFFVSLWLLHNVPMHLVRWQLEQIKGVVIIDMWGWDDLFIEEVAAHIIIDEQKEMILTNLSCDVFNYPSDVYLQKIGEYTFKCSSECKDYYYSINIGQSSPLGKRLGIMFYDIEDVIANYDTILNFIKTLAVAPAVNCLDDDCNCLLKVYREPHWALPPCRFPVNSLIGKDCLPF